MNKNSVVFIKKGKTLQKKPKIDLKNFHPYFQCENLDQILLLGPADSSGSYKIKTPDHIYTKT